jgi:hypothetical protein
MARGHFKCHLVIVVIIFSFEREGGGEEGGGGGRGGREGCVLLKSGLPSLSPKRFKRKVL